MNKTKYEIIGDINIYPINAKKWNKLLKNEITLIHSQEKKSWQIAITLDE